MSSVTDMFVIVGDTDDDHAEGIAPQVAEAIMAFGNLRLARLPVISLMRDDWESLQGGSRVAGSAVIWFGWNYADPEGLVRHLKAQGFKHLTVWAHHENDNCKPPLVVSW